MAEALSGPAVPLSWSTSKRPSTITVPQRANPLAKLVFAEMRRQGVTYSELEWRAGVLASTFKAWRGQSAPGLASIEAALGALGWALVPVPKLETFSPEVRASLTELSRKFDRDESRILACAMQAWKEWQDSISQSIANSRRRRLSK